MSHDAVSDINPTTNTAIGDVVTDRLENPARRGLFKGAALTAALGFIGASAMPRAVLAQAQAAPVAPRPAKLGFKAVPKSLADAVAVPEGYSAKVLFRLGDPMAANVTAYKNDGTDAAATFAFRAGDHHDAIEYFGIDANGRPSAASSTRGLLFQNHEAITPMFLHP